MERGREVEKDASQSIPQNKCQCLRCHGLRLHYRVTELQL